MLISQWLAAKDLTAKDLARIASISGAQLSRIINGVSRPSWETAQSISLATDKQVSASSLMSIKPVSVTHGVNKPSSQTAAPASSNKTQEIMR